MRVPGLHRRALVGLAEVGQNGVARPDVDEVALDDLLLVPFRPPAEVATHGIDRLVARLPQEPLRAAAVVVGERRPGEVDARHARTVRGMEPPSTEFVALGHAGSDSYAELETFPNPGVSHVEMQSDELAAICPVTSQPDLYVATIEFWPDALCLESKSLKLYLASFRNEGAFCEALTVKIRDDVASVLELPAEKVRVTLEQKARGGITITATS